MADVYIIITEPDYQGFSVIEGHLEEAAATARVEAANAYAEQAPAFPPDDCTDAEYDTFATALEAWRNAHPFGPEEACAYLQERYRVLPIPLGPAGVALPDGGQP